MLDVGCSARCRRPPRRKKRPRILPGFSSLKCPVTSQPTGHAIRATAIRDAAWFGAPIRYRAFMETIATFSKPEDAHLLRMRLESLGIQAFVQDENLHILDAGEGVRVQVADEDVQGALEAIAGDKGATPDATAA